MGHLEQHFDVRLSVARRVDGTVQNGAEFLPSAVLHPSRKNPCP